MVGRPGVRTWQGHSTTGRRVKHIRGKSRPMNLDANNERIEKALAQPQPQPELHG